MLSFALGLAVFVAVVWMARAVFVTKIQRQLGELAEMSADTVDSDETVSVIIPARDEQDNIGRCVRSILGQTYRNIEVIVVDDRSEDDTRKVVEEIAAEDDRLRCLHIEHLPDGWSGKSHALHVAAGQARGDWLLFTDADTEHASSNLAQVVERARRDNLEMVSLLSAMKTGSFWEHVLQPVLGGALMIQFPLNLVNKGGETFAFSNGQYILIRRDTYDKLGGHEAVKAYLLEDIAIARRARRMGVRSLVMLGQNILKVRMYESFMKIFKGWSRIYYGAFQGSVVRMLLAIVLMVLFALSPVALGLGGLMAGLTGGWSTGVTVLTGLSAGVLLLQMTTVWRFYKVNGCPPAYSLLYHVAVLIGIAVQCHSLLKCLGIGTIGWRGRRYAPSGG